MRTLIFANGDIADYEWIRPILADASLIIAADGGANHLYRLGRKPDIVIGDLDSVDDEILAWLEGLEIKAFPAEKNETDLELALIYATETSDAPIDIIGAFGGRVDQELANMLLLAHERWVDRPIYLRTLHQSTWVFVNQTTITGNIGDTVSLIPIGGDAHVQSTTGLRWELIDSTLQFGPARGISNVLSVEIATVKLATGMLLCVQTDQNWNR